MQMYIEMFHNEKIITHNLIVQTRTGQEIRVQQFDYLTYEGDWILFYCYIDLLNQLINIYFYSSTQDKRYLQTIAGSIIIDIKMKSVTGGYQNIDIDNEPRKFLQSYPGLILKVFITTDNVFNNLEQFLLDCPISVPCNAFKQLLITYNSYMFGNNKAYLYTQSKLIKNRYLLQGWIKQDILQYRTELVSLLLRITANQQYFDNYEVTDRVLYISYFQSKGSSQQNGFSLQTNSYIFPSESIKNFQNQNDIITAFGDQYKSLLTQWHYFQFETGTTTNNNQPIYSVKFPQAGLVEQYRWVQPIYHFSNTDLYFFIGGDDYSPNPFRGYLSDWNFYYFCDEQSPSFEVLCDYSCLTCKGISAEDCLSCQENSNRVYTPEQNTCICIYGYINVFGTPQCQELSQYYGALEMTEVEIVCEKKGYYYCDQTYQVCDYGYFSYENNCIQCPQYRQQNKQIEFLCANCYFYPDEFTNSQVCTMVLLSEDNSHIFYIYEYNFMDQQEVYIINFTVNLNYELQVVDSTYFDFGYYCKNGYYEDINGLCKACMEGCMQCFTFDICEYCYPGYPLGDDGLCLSCKICSQCTWYNGDELCLSADNCSAIQYWQNNKCYDCGQQCASCTSGQCYYCTDVEQYYITLDNINCAKCTIQHCKYCFQYIYSGNSLQTTLDMRTIGYNFSFYEARIGCALCQNNYFFSQITLLCEPSPSSMIDCDSGFINDEGTLICLKSTKRVDSIQSSNCENSNCLSCLNNYPKETLSFCIKCIDGFYPSYLTGQCKQCPENCESCIEQNAGYNDYWKWDVRAFYNVFVNQNGNHPFEQYNINLDQTQQELICLSCLSGQMLYKNSCYPGCDENCLDCRIIDTEELHPECFKCKPTTYNLQRSKDNQNYMCLICPDFCSACYPRTVKQMTTLNPLFNQQSKYLKYSHICYQTELTKKNDGFVSIIPQYQVANFCSEFKRCKKTLSMQYYVYCDPQIKDIQQELEQEENFKARYVYFQDILQYDEVILAQSDELFEYMNRLRITEAYYEFQIRYFSEGQICSIDSYYQAWLSSHLYENVFSLKRVSLNFLGPTTKGFSVKFSTILVIQNFDFVVFQNLPFIIPEPFIISGYNYSIPALGISMTNKKSQNILLLNCSFTQEYQPQYTKFYFTSDRPKEITISNMTFESLNITNSLMFNFQPTSDTPQAMQKIDQMSIDNSFFSNTSIFYYSAVSNSLNYEIHFQNISIKMSSFSSSFFINSTFFDNNDIGEIYIEDCYLENVTFIHNSAFIYLLSIQKLKITNLTLNNLQFLDSSSFLISNVMEIYLLSIFDSVINSGYFITNSGSYSKSEIVQENSKFINLTTITLKNNIYSNINSFLYLLQNEISNLTLHLNGLIISNNNYVGSSIGTYSLNYVSYKQTLIHLFCSYCYISNVQIFRGVGLPEISIINSQQLVINTLLIQLDSKYYLRTLHSSYECVKNFIYLDNPFVLYIGTYHNVIMNNIILQNSIVIDYSFILLVGLAQNEIIQNDSILINNSTFQNNLLIITRTNRFSSIIYISTEQSTTIIINNTKFNDNHLNKYYEDVQLRSSTTMLIEAQQGTITLDQSEFLQNVMTNSSETTLYIKAQILNINNCVYSKQNILNTDTLVKNILLPFDYQMIDITPIFQILSQGGNGYLFVSSLSIRNTKVENSIAVNGAGFYIVTQTEGIISIENSSFSNTSTVLNGYQLSSGGVFYIDSQNSKLNLNIINSTIHQAYSRTFGGAIYIEPSRLENSIILNYLTIISVFSLQHSILSYSPSKLISVSSNIFIMNSYFSNNQTQFESFISQISDLSLQNISPFQTENPAIFVQFSNFTLENCSFVQFHLARLIQLDYGVYINLLSLKVYNGTIFQSPIIRISLREDIVGQINIKHLEIAEMMEFTYNTSNKCDQQSTSNSQLLCPKDSSSINNSPIPLAMIQNLTNQQLCNLNSLFISTNYNFSLIELLNFEDTHFLKIYELTLADIICNNCSYGLLSIQGFNIASLNFRFDNIKLMNNVCGRIGCFSILQSVTNDVLSAFSFQNNNHLMSLNNLDIIIPEDQFQATLINSIFFNNKALYGGACFFTNITILVNCSFFVNNEAKVQGGAIYYYSSQSQLLIINSQIVENYAYVAAGIFLNSNQLEKMEELNLFLKHNQAIKFGDNLFEAPRKLYLSIHKSFKQSNSNLVNNSTTIIDQVNVNPYFVYSSQNQTDTLLLPSGTPISDYKYFDYNGNSYIPYNLSFRLLAANVLDEQVMDLENSQCTLQAQIINTTSQNPLDQFQFNINSSRQYLSMTEVSFDSQAGDYNLDNLTIYFNPLSPNQENLQLAFKCNSIQIPFYDEFSKETSNIINYILLLNLRSFQCQLGEYLNSTSGGCLLCDVSQNQYSVTINSTGCSYKDELKMKDIEPAMIELRQTYWRAFYFSETIEQCYHLLANCEGGWQPGNPSCALGHIGALCEQCDLYDIKGDGSFSQNQSYQCSSCEKMANNILNIVLVICWTLLSVFISVNSTVQMIRDLVFQLKLKPFGYFTIVKSASTSVLLKVFTNYLQIISSISSFQLQIPIGITLVVRGVGNPIESMAFSLDCYLKSITNIPIIYFRIIWGFLTAGIYIFLFFSIPLLQSYISNTNLNITFFTTTLIYIYIYLSPNLVSELTALVSYRELSNEKWIAANVAYLYETQQHQEWLLIFVAPAFFIIGILLPFVFWYVVYHHRTQLNSGRIRKIWGYLYNEYKVSTYYWETIKILQKELIILVMIYYEDFVVIKASLIFFILLLYNQLAREYKPYLTGNLNAIDYLSTSICQISIILASSIFTAQQFAMQEIVWPFYGILGIINLFFIIQMVSKLLFAYFDKLYDSFDKIKGFISLKFPSLAKKNKFCQRLLQNTTDRKQKVRRRYQQIRQYLLQQAKYIISYKECNNMGFTCGQQSSNEIVQKYNLSSRLTTKGTTLQALRKFS